MRLSAAALLLVFSGCRLGEYKDPRARVQALQQLRRLGARAAAPKIAALLLDPQTRGEPARALSDLGGPAQVQPLLDAIDPGASAGDNETIARALGNIADARAAPGLLRLAHAQQEPVRIAAVEALGKLKGKDAVPELSRVAEDPAASPALKAKALLALGQIGDPAALPALLHGLSLEPNRVSLLSESSLALLMIGAPAVEPLLQILEGKDPAYLSWARDQGQKTADVYARVALVWIGDRPQARDLMKKAKSGRLRLRLLAAQGAALFGEPIVGRDMLELAMKEAKGAPTSCLAELRELTLPVEDGTRACDLLATQFGELSNPLEAARVCASDAPCWLSKLRETDPVVRARAAYELGRAGTASAVPELAKAISDQQVLVRIAAARALEWLSAVPAARDDLKSASRALAQRLSGTSSTGAAQGDEDLRRLQLKLSRL